MTYGQKDNNFELVANETIAYPINRMFKNQLHRWALLLIILGPGCGASGDTLFEKLPASKTGINFVNRITETDSLNPIRTEFLYNGGGVAIGDFNNDSLDDVYFTASTTPNKLYLNKGNFEFDDVTAIAKVTGEGSWSNGATVVDINNDGREDLYISTTMKPVNQRKNLLYVNQGNNPQGIPVFREMAAEYGIADTSYSVQAVFFDYDLDGDLDLYLATTKPTSRNTYTFGNRKDSSRNDYDKLYRNDPDAEAGHPFFTAVSLQAGIGEKGYGLGVTVSDINSDGWPDIYVTNDFITSDHLYINNKNGTFTNRVGQSLKHSSMNAMGNDVSDINNDGWPDLVAVDMNPEDNFRKQKNMGAANYGKYRNMADFGYNLQFVRNTLQINQGPALNSPDTLIPVFSDISYYAGVAETDWSWAPSVADFDNDGLKDLLITNGYPKDVTDHDYISYRNDKGYIVSEKKLLEQIPEIRVANYAFRNNPDLHFSNVSKEWGLDDKAYSAGAAYADLDNDGDLDYIVNNTNSTAGIFRNRTDPKSHPEKNFLTLRFKGDPANIDGTGATVTVFSTNKLIYAENYPVRGYLSCMGSSMHIGLGHAAFADSIVVRWPGGKIQHLGKTTANQNITLSIKDAATEAVKTGIQPPLFSNITNESGIDFIHEEYDFIDFDHQRLLPHKLSETGSALASGDLDGNGLDDIFISGPKGKSATFFLQQPNGSFIPRKLQHVAHPSQKPFEETGVLLIDLDSDHDLDLYLCSGSVEFAQHDPAFNDRIFINDGRANFSEATNALPLNLTSKQVLKAADFDNDGDLDLFIAGRSIPDQFPKPASGFIYRNDSRKNEIRFTDITATMAPQLKELGMVTDATWSDFNSDGKPDLVICGEFMPVTFLRNDGSRFTKVGSGTEGTTGLFNSITAADLNNDGKMDYVLGNLGLNSFYKATTTQPFTVYANDFDKNGSLDAIPFVYLKDQHGNPGQYPAFTRDDLFKQMPRIKSQFPTYKSFAEASLDALLTKGERDSAIKVSANYTQSSILMNKGGGRFELIALPYKAQWSPVFGILADDFDNDGNPDLLLNTNDLGTEVNTGQYDALNGLLLKGNGDGSFRALGMQQSGIDVPSNGKSVVHFLYKGKYTVAISQNKGALKLFRLNTEGTVLGLLPGETVADYLLKNGKTRHLEFFEGSTFGSQDSRTLRVNHTVERVSIYSAKGSKREVTAPTASTDPVRQRPHQ